MVVAFGMGSEGCAARFTGGLPQRESADSLAEVLSGVEVPFAALEGLFVGVEVLFVSCAFVTDAADAIETIASAAQSFRIVFMTNPTSSAHARSAPDSWPARASVAPSLLLRSEDSRLRRMADRLGDDQRTAGFVSHHVRAGVERPFA
jgi:hypothetical protein